MQSAAVTFLTECFLSGARKFVPSRVLEYLKQNQCLKTMLHAKRLFQMLSSVEL